MSCIACGRATGPSDYSWDTETRDDGGPDDPLDHEDYRDLDLLGLWPDDDDPLA